jgi:small subunit ribosomal protein S8
VHYALRTAKRGFGMTDPISDMLSRVRNAVAVKHDSVSVPHSKTKEAVAKLLQENGFISGVSIADNGVGKVLKLNLSALNQPARIVEVARLSKPGRRLYTSAKQIPVIKRGRGVVIISTSNGMMTGEQARKQQLGGELICKVF